MSELKRYLDDPQWRHALQWWTIWNNATKLYAYRYMMLPHKRGKSGRRLRRRFERCRERMHAADARTHRREQEIRAGA